MCKIEGSDFDSGPSRITRIEKSRKQRWCDTCDAELAVGAPYVTVWWVSDGNNHTEVACPACWDANETFAKSHALAWISPGSFLSLLGDCVVDEDDPTDPWRPMLTEIATRLRDNVVRRNARVAEALHG